MYLPKFKYKKAKFAVGAEFKLPNGKRYVGWYFETYKGEYYSGREPGNNNQLLTRINTNVQTLRLSSIFTPTRISTTAADKKQGYFMRYFLQDRRNKKIVEVKKDKYLENKDVDYLDKLEIRWVIKKPIEDMVQFDYRVEGAATKNKRTIEEIESKFPGIKSLIKSYGEFVE